MGESKKESTGNLLGRISGFYNGFIDEAWVVASWVGATSTKVLIPLFAAMYVADKAQGPLSAMKERIMPSAHAEVSVKLPIDTSCVGAACGTDFDKWCQTEKELCKKMYPFEQIISEIKDKGIKKNEFPPTPRLKPQRTLFLNLGEEGIAADSIICSEETNPKVCEKKLAANVSTGS